MGKIIKYATLFMLALACIFLTFGFSTSDGRLIFRGPAMVYSPVVYDDIRAPANVIRILGVPADPDWGVFRGSVYTYLFDDSTDEETWLWLQLPHSYKLGTDLDCHIHWSPMTANTGNVRWCMAYTFGDIGATMPNPAAATCVNSAADNEQYKHLYADLMNIDGSGISGVSAMLGVYLYREGTDGVNDTFTGDAAFFEFDCHFQMDTPGSGSEQSKE
jgi:hypothetical protein